MDLGVDDAAVEGEGARAAVEDALLFEALRDPREGVLVEELRDLLVLEGPVGRAVDARQRLVGVEDRALARRRDAEGDFLDRPTQECEVERRQQRTRPRAGERVVEPDSEVDLRWLRERRRGVISPGTESLLRIGQEIAPRTDRDDREARTVCAAADVAARMVSAPPSSRSTSATTPTTSAPTVRKLSIALSVEPPVVITSSRMTTRRPGVCGRATPSERKRSERSPSSNRRDPWSLASLRT